MKTHCCPIRFYKRDERQGAVNTVNSEQWMSGWVDGVRSGSGEQ